MSGGSYAAQSFTNDGTEWSIVSSTVDNDNDIDFPAATASWGTVVAASLEDASSGGNMLFWANLTSPQTVTNGSEFSFTAGNFRVTLD